MMWIGKMVNCPIDLPSQGQLIKHDKVKQELNTDHKKNISKLKYCCRWSSGVWPAVTTTVERGESSLDAGRVRNMLSAICFSSRRRWCCAEPTRTCQNQTTLISCTTTTSGESDSLTITDASLSPYWDTISSLNWETDTIVETIRAPQSEIRWDLYCFVPAWTRSEWEML